MLNYSPNKRPAASRILKMTFFNSPPEMTDKMEQDVEQGEDGEKEEGIAKKARMEEVEAAQQMDTQDAEEEQDGVVLKTLPSFLPIWSVED